jgi:hypothetical protein
MLQRLRVAMLAASLAVALLTLVASAASANPLALLGGNCGFQTESHPFTPWGDGSSYTPVLGGDFESAFSPWLLSGGAARAAGNESFQVAGPGSSSLTLPAGSAALSPASCTNIFHPTVRLFVRNTGSVRSHLTVQALYPGLLGGVQTATVATLTGSSSWAPSPAIGLLTSNLLSTLSLNETVIAFRFLPADSAGNWSIDDVYLDPFGRA